VKIYTKTGDTGETGLIGSRVRKDDPRVCAYGEVDELNAVLGLVASETTDAQLVALLPPVQRDLFAIGAQLADPQARVTESRAKAQLPPERISDLERAIDECEEELPPLRAFILPGGSRVGASLHVARGVCRRAERTVVALAAQSAVDPRIIVYLNRLSDLLFVLARRENHRAGRPEETW
jgi:cob(I)alamin adenosyltransferase